MQPRPSLGDAAPASGSATVVDGSIRYAENPPKRYQDIYPFDFDSDDAANLWQALRDVMLFWVGQGVRVFRVDNPHTKPFRFWQWLIERGAPAPSRTSCSWPRPSPARR